MQAAAAAGEGKTVMGFEIGDLRFERIPICAEGGAGLEGAVAKGSAKEKSEPGCLSSWGSIPLNTGSNNSDKPTLAQGAKRVKRGRRSCVRLAGWGGNPLTDAARVRGPDGGLGGGRWERKPQRDGWTWARAEVIQPLQGRG